MSEPNTEPFNEGGFIGGPVRMVNNTGEPIKVRPLGTLSVAPVGTPLPPDLEGFEPIGHVANPATIRPRLSDVLGEALRDAGLSATYSLWLPGDPTGITALRSIPADELLAGVDDPTLTTRPLTREHAVTFTVQKVNRRTLRLLFGDAVPRSARSMRRRRANLRRKRQMRKKHR